MSVQVSNGIIAICMIVIASGAIIATLVVVIIAFQIRKYIALLTRKTSPLIIQAADTMKNINQAVEKVKNGTEDIVNKTEETVDGVTQKIKFTTSMIQETINTPLITLASTMTGITRGLELLNQIRKRGGNDDERRKS